MRGSFSFLFIFISAVNCDTPTIDRDEFHYHGETGPKHWAELYPEFCNGTNQSPIDIHPNETVAIHEQRIIYSDYFHRPALGGMKIENNGHTVVITITDPYVQPMISGGGLPGEYVFDSLHFHYGNAEEGSEHTIEGKRYALEMHLVHHKREYGNISVAQNQPDGLVVIAILYKRSYKPNPVMYPILDAVRQVKFKGDEAEISRPFALNSILPHPRFSFYKYKGSLTTPTCNEVVTFLILRHKLTVSPMQLQGFHELRESANDADYLEHNFRPAQPLNGRTVYKVDTSPFVPEYHNNDVNESVDDHP